MGFGSGWAGDGVEGNPDERVKGSVRWTRLRRTMLARSCQRQQVAFVLSRDCRALVWLQSQEEELD